MKLIGSWAERAGRAEPVKEISDEKSEGIATNIQDMSELAAPAQFEKKLGQQAAEDDQVVLPPVFHKAEEDDQVSLSQTTPSMVSQQDEHEHSHTDHSSEPMEGDKAQAGVNWGDIESDTDSEADEDPDEHPSARHEAHNKSEMISAPVMWCSSPTNAMAHVEGYMAVTLPKECAPPGAFDGLWKSKADEKILIEQLEIMFESGVVWDMEMHSLTEISVTIDGEKIYGERDITGQELLWSNGDKWFFFGEASPRAQDALPCSPGSITELPCMMMPFVPGGFPVTQDMTMPPRSEWIPRQELPGQWDVCWDWGKKGWCARGADCTWYHPMPEASACESSESPDGAVVLASSGCPW